MMLLNKFQQNRNDYYKLPSTVDFQHDSFTNSTNCVYMPAPHIVMIIPTA